MTKQQLKIFIQENSSIINNKNSRAIQQVIDASADWDNTDRAQVTTLFLRVGYDISLENPVKGQNGTFIGTYHVEELENFLDKDYLSMRKDYLDLSYLADSLVDPMKIVLEWDVDLYDAHDLPRDFTPEVVEELKRLGVEPGEVVDVIQGKIYNQYSDEIGSAAASAYVGAIRVAYSDDLERQIKMQLLQLFPAELNPELIYDGYGHASVQISGSYKDFADIYNNELTTYMSCADDYYEFQALFGRYLADNYQIQYSDQGVFPDEKDFYTFFADNLSAIKE